MATKPKSFEVLAYTGGLLEGVRGFEEPVVVDLAGMSFAKNIVANLDHDRTRRVGHVTQKEVVNGQLVLAGVASAATDARREVVESAAGGFTWQASIEANPTGLRFVKDGETIKANGQSFKGPLYYAPRSKLTGFAFVSNGADEGTSVTIAARAGGDCLRAVPCSWALIPADPQMIARARSQARRRPSHKPARSAQRKSAVARPPRRVPAECVARLRAARLLCQRGVSIENDPPEEVFFYVRQLSNIGG